MAARPLYELTAGFNAIFDLVLDETMDLDALEEALKAIECEVEEKCANGIALIRSLEFYAGAYKTEKERFAAQKNALENRIKRIKEWYRQNLDAMGRSHVQTKYGTMSVQGNGGQFPLKIDDERLIPAEYLKTIPEHKEVDTEKLYKALEQGDAVPGAHLDPRGRSLRIR